MKEVTTEKYLYRYEGQEELMPEEEEEGVLNDRFNCVRVEEIKFLVIRNTPCGAWVVKGSGTVRRFNRSGELKSNIDFGLLVGKEIMPDVEELKRRSENSRYYEKRFVNLQLNRKYACSTKEEALEQFISRKKYYHSILERKIGVNERVLEIAEKVMSLQEEKPNTERN